MNLYDAIDGFMASLANFLWGTPLVILLLGGGFYFSIISRLIPFAYLRHAIDILLGKYDSEDDPGQITHFQALSSALSSTVGMGNIAGVALAIHTGGPGAIFWMWCTAVLGMSTKFFTCTLALMYRGKDDQGEIQGGVMYYIEKGLGEKFKPLAMMFSISGLFGCTIFFQSNQLSQIIREYLYNPIGIFQYQIFTGDLVTGCMVAALVGTVIFGGIKRIAKVASTMVPIMVGIYLIAAIIIIGKNIHFVPNIFSLIIQDAFSGTAVAGGAVGSMISIGVRRGLFSNEAG
ncbi:MAG: alanine:cation symporter family protein, partial [Candidatus Neomarinimicrobiota bacterium]|nr:alanine:cation symporter family protein [Candidatus Neomarinimicrobiota bacterium]